MAPLRSLPSSAVAPRKSILKNSSRPKKLEAESLFTATKQDKRRIKHAQLLSKVEQSSKKTRRRRPNKKFVTNLNSLADALPSDDEIGDKGVSGTLPEDQVNIIRRKSMKSRPGAMKRREKLDQSERDRFAKNLAQIAGNSGDLNQETSGTPKTEDRWKALRGFIAQTMEKKPELGQAPN